MEEFQAFEKRANEADILIKKLTDRVSALEKRFVGGGGGGVFWLLQSSRNDRLISLFL